MEKSRVGIVSFGFVVSCQVNSWRRNRAEVVAVCDSAQEKASELCVNLA